MDSGRSQCEANEKCGLAAETRGEYGQSREFLIDARKISRGRTNWKHDNGITWHQQVGLFTDPGPESFGPKLMVRESWTETHGTRSDESVVTEIIIFYRIQCIWLEF